jgi:hypothetical protein
MAWTTPGTAVAGEVLTAARWNTDVRDNTADLDTRVNNSGLIWISTTTLTTIGTSGQVISNIFSSTYNNYVLHLNLSAIASGPLTVFMQLSVGGTPNATVNSYVMQRLRVEDTSATVSGVHTADTKWTIANQTGTLPFDPKIELASPFLTRATHFATTSITRGSTWYSTWMDAYHTQATSYDGVKLFTDTGTFTGTLRVYGYKN